MGAIARGEITLCPINDAYSVSLTPSSYSFHSSFDGSSSDLSNATITLQVFSGGATVPFELVSIEKTAGVVFQYVESENGAYLSFVGSVASIPSDSYSGYIDFQIRTLDSSGFATTVRFTYTVIRDSSMLDWVLDWDSGKTKIGGSYIMTPKIFIGKKEDVVEYVEDAETGVSTPQWKENALTGVYIGPDLLERNNYGVGIYGYLADKEVFHLNADGGFIGGWTFTETGLKSSNGVVTILSQGSICANNPLSETPYWGIFADGTASFANGNVTFGADGSASFEGAITALAGEIAGWVISKNQIANDNIVIDSKLKTIAVYSGSLTKVIGTGDFVIPDTPVGGVKMWYTSGNDYGLAGYTASSKVFQIGNENLIAGWKFNHQAIWTGSSAPYLSQGTYAQNAAELTIAPNGIRSHKWYVDADGTAEFSGGSVKFNTVDGELFGWLLKADRLVSSHVSLSSLSSFNGIFASPADLSDISASSLVSTIEGNGGVYLCWNGTNATLKAYDKSGNLGFSLSTDGTHTIGNWNFNHNAIYIGYLAQNTNGFMANSGSMMLSTTGLRGYKWKILADGSGALANGNIKWTASGDVILDSSVSISWDNTSCMLGAKLTSIDATGVYTGTITADQITAGSITTDWIKKDGYWALNADGSGYLAKRNVEWNVDGDITVKGNIQIKTLSYDVGETVDLANGGALINLNVSTWNGVLPALANGESRRITIVWRLETRTSPTQTITRANSNVKIYLIDDLDAYSALEITWGAVFEIYGFAKDGNTEWVFAPVDSVYIISKTKI